ncbi:MAG TPA: type VI secretion system baseplate subunit TssG [Bryobacteraceae bacterium]|nr:type VI secretion system baseplate subunit TssG [Bryobacteraceae bacterium]
MADLAYGWRKSRSVEEWLFEEPFRFEFYQAVRLLEILRRRGLEEGREEDAVRFRSRVSFDFPASEVHSIEENGGTPLMTVNFLGLAGALGPLPAAYSEMVIAAIANRDRAAADFLDIFNHRLVTLLYRTRQVHRPPLTSEAPDKGSIARHLFSLIGLGLPHVRKNVRIPPRSLLHYSGLLARRPGSAAGLEKLLSDFFDVPVRVHQFVGLWRTLDSAQQTTIGPRGRNQAIGGGAVLGKRVWDQGASVVIAIGPIGFDRFENLLSGRPGHRAMCAMAHFYLGNERDAEVHLILKAKDVPVCVIGQSRLGYTSWLRASEFQGADQAVRVSLNT